MCISMAQSHRDWAKKVSLGLLSFWRCLLYVKTEFGVVGRGEEGD